MRIYLHDNFINITDCNDEDLQSLKKMTDLKKESSIKIIAETEKEKAELYDLLLKISIRFDATII